MHKTKSAADQDLDWRSARPSIQNSPPSTAFKSLYKSPTARGHSSNSYPALKPNRQNDEPENEDRRDSFGVPDSDFLETTDLRHPAGGRLKRLHTGSPRLSECSSIGSDNETTRGSKIAVSKRPSRAFANAQEDLVSAANSQNMIPDNEQDFAVLSKHPNLISKETDFIPCSNIFSTLSQEKVADREDAEALDTSFAEDFTASSPCLDDTSENHALDPEEDADDQADGDDLKSSKKIKSKPRRRRFKKNKKPVLSEMTENCSESQTAVS